MQLLIRTHLIPADGTTFEGEFKTDGLLDAVTSPVFKFTGPAHYKFHCSPINSAILIRGIVTAPGEAECVRCLETFDCPIVAEPLEFYIETIPADGVVDLGEDVRDELLVRVPDFPHCKEDCAGLCLTCGADLNQGACNCGKPAKKTAKATTKKAEADEPSATKLGTLLDEFFPEKPKKTSKKK